MTPEIDPHAVLGVPPHASPDEVRTAYRQAARATHPDLNPHDAEAAERFKRVQRAYELLTDPRRRVEPAASAAPAAAPSRRAPRRTTAPPDPEPPISLSHELRETIAAIRVVARRSGLSRRLQHLIRYLESL